eukprot:GGOE01020975.1.p2 GENE.GGOE01020975.1~~GGOE01020975.1.p2  ORF type:complete len:137 (-),score=21.97 GGOE01020975.1:480-890(-)
MADGAESTSTSTLRTIATVDAEAPPGPVPEPPNRHELEPIPLPPQWAFSSGLADDFTAKYESVSANLSPGFERYCAIRRAWTSSTARPQRTHRAVDVDAVCECLASARPTAFKHPIPLKEMVGILEELWEDDGLFD